MDVETNIKFCFLAHQLCHEYDPGIPGNDSIFNQSFKKLGNRINPSLLLSQISELEAAGHKNIFSIFPTRKEITTELVPLLAKMRMEYPLLTMGLSISNPVCLPHRASLNIVIRLANEQNNIGVKIKISVFQDDKGEIFYEVGYVDVSKSIHHLKRNFVDQQPVRRDYFLLQSLVDCTKKMIARRKKITGLDLTPAYYHVLPLCLRLGGFPADFAEFEEWKKNLELIIDHSIRKFKEADPATSSTLATVPRRVLATWLFENKLVTDPLTGLIVNWRPPRLVYKS